MTEPKFSVGDHVIHMERLGGIRGQRAVVVEAFYFERASVWGVSSGESADYTGWCYRTTNHDGETFSAEKNLAPIPPPQKSTWEDVQKATGWNPYRVSEAA